MDDELNRELDDIQDRLRKLEQAVVTPPSRTPQASGGGGLVRAVTVTSVGADTLTCNYNGQTMTVKKPYELQRTPFDGNLITYLDSDIASVEYAFSSNRARTATGSEGAVNERIIPAYISGGTILAVKVGADWWDMNIGGRAWAEV